MELPDVGKQCALQECKQLDYLPFKCVYCKKSFCFEHAKPDQHQCVNAPEGDGARVPVCPICNAPVPVNRGENPNFRMEQHIATNCSDKPKSASSKPFNSCHFCKARVPMKLECAKCKKTYCIKHRHETDHRCSGQPQQASRVSAKVAAGNAAAARQQGQMPPVSPTRSSKNTIKSFVGKLFRRKSSSKQ